MADLTADDLERALDKFSKSIVRGFHDPKSAKNKGDTANVDWSSSGKDAKGFGKALNQASQTLNKLGTTEFNQMAGHVRNSYTAVKSFGSQMQKTEGVTKKFGLGLASGLTLAMAAGAGLAGFMKDSLNSYRDFRSYGQNFQGSILGMHLAAAQARMPLEEFAKALQKNKSAIAVLGVNTFSKLSVNLRNSMMDIGELGMSTSDLNEVVGNYMDTMLLFGKTQNLASAQATMSMRGLAVEASMLAAATGKDRMELLQNTKSAMNVATLRATAADFEGEAQEKFINSMTSATMFMTALPGEAGKTLSNMLAETVGNGSSLLTGEMGEFAKAGMYGVGNMMDEMSAKIKSGKKIDAGEMANFYQEFLKEGENALPTLRFQASVGNAEAKKMLAMYKDMEQNREKFTEKALKDAEESQKKQDAITNATTNLETVFNNLTGAIKEKFFKTLIDFTSSKAFDDLSKDMATLGKRVGELWDRVFTPQNMAMAERAFNFLANTVVTGLDMLANVVIKVMDVFKALSARFGALNTVVGTLIAAFVLYKAQQKIRKELKDSKDRVAAKEATREGVSAALKPLIANSALRVVDIASGGNHAVENMSGELDANHKRRQERMDRVARGRASRERGRRLGRMARSVKNFGGRVLGGKLGGAASLASAGASIALDAAPDFKGKDTLSNALSFGAMGAQVGMMFGPLGAAIGGGIGALAGVVLANWEPIKAGLGKALDWLGSAFSSIWDWAKEIFKFTPLGLAYNAFKFVADNGLGGTWEAIKKGFGDAFDSVANIFSSIGSWLSDKFDWLTKFDVMGTIRKALGAVPGIGGTLVKAFNTAVGVVTGGVAGGNDATTVPNVEVDALKKRIDDLQKQLDQQRKDNQIIHQQLDKLIKTVDHGNKSNDAHNKAQLDETKKGNAVLSSPMNGLV